MGDIAYATGQQVIQFVATQTAQVAGSSAIDTAAALRAAEWAQNGGGSIVSFPFTVIKGGMPISLEAQYASQLWNYWKITAGAAVTSVGAAASAASAWASGVLFGDASLAGTLAGTGGLLTASVPATAAAVMPLLGVGFGYAMYDLAPEFWTKVSQTLLPWAYEDSEAIPMVVDQNGQVYADKAMVDALKQLFIDEGVPINGNLEAVATYNGVSVPFAGSATGTGPVPVETYTAVGGVLVTTQVSGGNSYFKIYSQSPGAYIQYTYRQHAYGPYTSSNGTVYYCSNALSARNFSLSPAPAIGDGAIADVLFNGTISIPEYPSGTYEWEGTQVDIDDLPTIPVVSSTDGSTTPYVPISLHDGDQTSTADPVLYPDPTAIISDPSLLDPYISPDISPVVSPEMWPDPSIEFPYPSVEEMTAPQSSTDPLYVPAPDLNPNADPSALPDIEPAQELPTNIDPPISGGQSPDPTFPVPNLPFPCWTPQGSDTPVVSGQAGFIQIYHPSTSEFISFGRWLWVMYNATTIDKIWNNPFDGVIGAHELYATPADGGYSTIRCGFLDSGISTQVINQRYTQINCGSILIPEYWGNYLDYSPYSQCMIYLPFIGIVDLEVDDIVGAAVNVLYHVDSYTGACIAQITVAKEGYSNTLYQFSGNCSVEIPMTGGSQAQIKAALMTANAYQNAANVSATASLLGGIGSGLASAVGGTLSGGAIASTGNFAGGMAAGIGGAASGLSSIINGYASSQSQRAYGAAQHTANMLSGKSIVQHSGTFGASHGAMGIKKPYLIIRRPIQKVVNRYQDLYGFPAHKQVIIGSCKGFLRCREVHVLSSVATDAEKNIIEQLLTSGVYVTESVD